MEVNFPGKAEMEHFTSQMEALISDARDACPVAPVALRCKFMFELLMYSIPSASTSLRTDYMGNAAMPLWAFLAKHSGRFGEWLEKKEAAPWKQAFMYMALSSLWLKTRDKRPFCLGLSEFPDDSLQWYMRKQEHRFEAAGDLFQKVGSEFPAMAEYFDLVDALEGPAAKSHPDAPAARLAIVKEAWSMLLRPGSALQTATVGTQTSGAASCFHFTQLSKAQLTSASLRDKLLDFSTLTLCVWRSLALLTESGISDVSSSLRIFLNNSQLATQQRATYESSADPILTLKDIFSRMLETMDWQTQLTRAMELAMMPSESQLILPQRVVNNFRGVDLDSIYPALCGAREEKKQPNRCAAESGDSRAASIEAAPLSLAAAAVYEVRTALTERIPQDVDFCGCSATARDPDQVTRLLRRIIYLPTAAAADGAHLGVESAPGVPLQLLHRLVFQRDGVSRKRRRADDPRPEAIPLLPVISDLSTIFDSDDSSAEKTVLERIAADDCWKA